MLSRPLNRRTLLRGTAAATAASWLATRHAGAQDAPADAAETQEFRFAINSAEVSLDPHLSYGVTTIGLFTYFMWAGLTKMDATLGVVPDIATRWDISDDGTVYTFHLDPTRQFSDGSPLTAHDVVWSWTRSLNPETQSVVAGGYLRDVVGAVDYWQGVSTEPPTGYRAVDDYTFEVQLIEPRNYFPAILVFPAAFVVKQSDVERGDLGALWPTEAEAFSGPYAIASYEPDQLLELTPNPNHPIPQQIQTVTYRLVDDPQTRFLLYQNDEVDFAPIAEADADNIKNEDPTYRDQLIEQPQWWENNLYLRNELAPFDDERVRRAFMMAIDEEAVLESVLRGLNPDIDGVYYPGMAVYTDDLPRIPFDPEAARAELEASSYGGADDLPSIGFWSTDAAAAGTEARVAAAIQEMWRQNLGVEVETRVVPSYTEMLESDVQIVVGGEALHYPDASNAIHYLLCDSGSNIAQFCDEEWEAMVDEAASTPDEARSIELYQAAQRELIERAVLYPLYQVTAFALVKPHVRNLQTTSMYTFPTFNEVYIAEE